MWTTCGSDGKDYTKDSFKGEILVLYFYPKDSTPSCTMEALDFSSLKSEFEKENAVIVGISKDNMSAHKKFIQKNNLDFLLLSDEDKEIHEKFNVIVPKKMFGKEYKGVDRSTFVFDEEGDLILEYRKVKVKGHAEKVLKDIRKYNKEKVNKK